MENMTHHMKERYMRLERRMLFLRNRIFENTHLHKEMGFDKEELSSLEWAMRIIVKYYKEHPKEKDFEKPIFNDVQSLPIREEEGYVRQICSHCRHNMCCFWNNKKQLGFVFLGDIKSYGLSVVREEEGYVDTKKIKSNEAT